RTDGTPQRYWYFDGMKSPRGDYYWEYNEPHKDDDPEWPTIDHMRESVAAFWNRVGRFTDQETRGNFYDGSGSPDANLHVVPQQVNARMAKLEPKMLDEVGVNFRGKP